MLHTSIACVAVVLLAAPLAGEEAAPAPAPAPVAESPLAKLANPEWMKGIVLEAVLSRKGKAAPAAKWTVSDKVITFTGSQGLGFTAVPFVASQSKGSDWTTLIRLESQATDKAGNKLMLSLTIPLHEKEGIPRGELQGSISIIKASGAVDTQAISGKFQNDMGRAYEKKIKGK